MKTQNIYKTLNSYKKMLENKGYEVIYIALYGSQNYNLDDELSDIDARAVVLLNIEQLLKREVVSKTIDYENGQIDVKDVMSYIEQLNKGNPAYVETANTNYYIGNKEFRNLINGYDFNPKAAIGMMYEKRKAIEKYLPTSMNLSGDEYDPKQYHHIVRLRNMLIFNKTWYAGKPRERMLKLKRDNTMTRSEILVEADALIKGVESKEYKYSQNDNDVAIYKWLEKQYVPQVVIEPVMVVLEQHRTFGNDIPRNVNKALSDKQREYLKDKDIGIFTTYEIEIY